MSPKTFELPFGNCILRGDTYKMGSDTIILHGAGKSSRVRFLRLRQSLNDRSIPSTSFDFIGHGETGGSLLGSTLHERTDQAAAVIRHTCKEPLSLIAASMSGYTAIKLTELFSVDSLVLLVPAVYTHRAYDLSFGTEFSSAIRTPGSWRDSDAFDILSEFRGKLLVIAAESDNVIPREVVDRIYASARNAVFRLIHIISGAGHLSLFQREQDYLSALDMIVGICQNRWNEKSMQVLHGGSVEYCGNSEGSSPHFSPILSIRS